MKIYIGKDSAGKKLYTYCFLIQKPGKKVSYYEVLNDDTCSKNLTRIVFDKSADKKCRQCQVMGLSCSAKFDTYSRTLTHLDRKANGKPMAVIVWKENDLAQYSLAQKFDQKHCYSDDDDDQIENAEVPSESDEPEPDHQPNRKGDERSARAAVQERPPAGNRVRIDPNSVPADLAEFCDLEIDYHGKPDGLQTEIPNRCPTLYLKPVHLAKFREFVRFLFEVKLDKYGILLFVLPAEFGAAFKNFTFDQLSYMLGKFPVLRQSVHKSSNGCYTIIGETEGNYNGQSFKAKQFTLNEFRAETGRTERAGRQTRENCLSYLRKASRAKIGLYATDINRDPTSGKLNNIIGTVLRSTNIPGVSSPYSYAAAFLNSFNLHVEDLDLHSTSFHLCGEPKYWWGVAGVDKPKVVDYLKNRFPTEFKACPYAFKHKAFFIDPQNLRAADIPVFEADQEVNTAVFTFPAAFHEGLNAGQSIAVAINLDSEQWFLNNLRPAIEEKCKCGQLKNTVTEVHLKRVIEWWEFRLSAAEQERRKRMRREQ